MREDDSFGIVGLRGSNAATPIHVVDRAGFDAAVAALPAAERQWLHSQGFGGAPDSLALVPDESGRLKAVWVGVRDRAGVYALSALPQALPEGRYRLASDTVATETAVLSWALGSYAFARYRSPRRAVAQLACASEPATKRALTMARAIAQVRDLVNTPAEDLGPEELAQAARALARTHGGRFSQVVGDDLLKRGFPAIHAVGRASTRKPRLIELNWGRPRDPKLVLVGKGVCFDSGGLDIKGADGMRLMKKDMGGAANALGLAQLIMAQGLRVRLQVLIPAVDNAISGNAYRPGDVFRTRSGLHIEIGNTDAEGRVILCDALAYGAESRPALMIDMATLTGAARVALGPQLPALFCRDTALARQLVDRGLALQDPMWHMPLWDDYHALIESPIADIVNTGRNAFAGAVTAALFLQDFVPQDVPWLHLDLFAWNDTPRPGRPVGGEAQTVRTLLAYLEERFG